MMFTQEAAAAAKAAAHAIYDAVPQHKKETALTAQLFAVDQFLDAASREAPHTASPVEAPETRQLPANLASDI